MSERAVEGAWFDCWTRTIREKTLITDLRMGVGSVSKRVCECVRVRVRTSVILMVSKTVCPKSAYTKRAVSSS